MALTHAFRAFALSVVLAGAVAPVAVLAYEPARGSPVRTGIVDGLRPFAERDLGPPVLFNISTLSVEGHWAFISARPVRSDGSPVDWSRTRFARQKAADMMSDVILALLTTDGQTWRVVEYALGPTDVAWEEWIDKHGLPRRLFDPTSAATDITRPPPPQPQPQPVQPVMPVPQAAQPVQSAPPPPPPRPPQPAVSTAPQAQPQPAPQAQQTMSGWRNWRLGDVAFSAPSDWRRIDTPAPALKIGGPPWSATFASRPADPGRGVSLVFTWGEEDYIYARSVNSASIRGNTATTLAGQPATRTDFALKDRYNDFAGFDVYTTAKVAGGVLSIGCRAPNADWPRVQPVCDYVLSTVTFTLPGQAPVAPAPQPQPQASQQASPQATPQASQPKPPVAAAPQAKDPAFTAFTTAMEKLEAFETSKAEEDWRAALEAALQATEAGPEVADYWRILGYIYSLGASEAQTASVLAEEAFEKAIELDPKNAGSRMLLAGVLVKSQSFARALDNLEIALELKPETATAAIIADMCRIYIVDELAARGERYFAKFVSIHPKVPAARLGQAILLAEMGQKQRALPLAERVANDPTTDKDSAEHARGLVQSLREAK